MKKIFSFAASALLLAGCQSEDFTGSNSDQVSDLTNQAISFGVTDVKSTRGTEVGAKAAALLNNNFILHGFKLSGAEDGNGTTDQVVIDRYTVNYEDGTGNQTQSNTVGWEYVGNTPASGSSATSQTIKYWDYSANGYVFSAVAGLDITTSKIATGTSIYDKGWNVTIPAGGTLEGLYASNRNYMANPYSASTPNGRYSNPVTLNFYNIATKVRFAMYETVAGYSIKIDKFYYNSTYSETNFGVDGKFKVLDNSAAAVAKVTYYSPSDVAKGLGLLNHPKVEWTSGITGKDNMDFGTNIPAQTKIGTTSAEATYDQAGGVYTFIVPFQDNANTLSLKVDYTLTSTDGSNETIKVYGATATVPANYTQWKENFAYTYLFKISDKTNGSTTPGGPEGLFPITFDACVITEEEGIQETVTSLGEPAITTYAKGTVATANDEYTAGDIYFSATQAQAPVKVESANVFEVYNYGDGEITEALVANYLKNKVVLAYVPKTEAVSVPLSDNSTLAFDAKYCYKFTASAGKTYVIQYPYDTDKYAYKVVKVAGAAANPTYVLTGDGNARTIATQTGAVTYKLTSNSGMVLGAPLMMKVYKNGTTEDVSSKFDVVETGNGNYQFSLTAEAVQAGAVDGNYDVKFVDPKTDAVLATGSCALVVDLDYSFANYNGGTAVSESTITVIAGKSANFQIIAGTQAVVGAVIPATDAKITIKETAAGVYEVSAAASCGIKDFNYTIAGQTLTVHVVSYSITANAGKTTLVWAEDDGANVVPAPTQDLTLSGNGEKANKEIASSDEAVIAKATTDADGKFTVTALAGGKSTLSYENATIDITVNKYELVTDAAKDAKTFKKATGSATLTLKCSGSVISASAGKATVKKYNGVAYEQVTTGFSLTTKGQTIVLGNVTAAGKYKIEYKDTNILNDVIANEYIEVTE